MKDKQHNSTHTQPARNPLVAPENRPKLNFANSPKRNLDQVNCSGDQTSVTTIRTVSGPRKNRKGESKKDKRVYTA
jgi:hypothetical protein